MANMQSLHGISSVRITGISGHRCEELGRYDDFLGRPWIGKKTLGITMAYDHMIYVFFQESSQLVTNYL